MRILLPVNSFTDCIKKIFPLDHIQAIWCYLKQKSMKYAKKISWQMRQTETKRNMFLGGSECLQQGRLQAQTWICCTCACSCEWEREHYNHRSKSFHCFQLSFRTWKIAIKQQKMPPLEVSNFLYVTVFKRCYSLIRYKLKKGETTKNTSETTASG